MLRKSLVILIAAIILLGFSFKIYALVPHFINYQGKLSNGPVPLNGTFTMTFRIYDTPTDGIFLWEETRSVEAKQGVFNVTLGEVTPLDLLFDQDYWLGVQIEQDHEMTPRQRIVSVGYSYMAEDSYFLAGHTPGPGNGLDADTVDGAHAVDLEESAETDSKIATHKADPEAHHTKNISFSELSDTATDDQIPNDITIEHATTADSATTASDADTVDGKHADEFLDASDNIQNKSGGLNIGGNLGIGTSNPEAKLHVIGDIHSNGVIKIDDYNPNSHINTYESGSGYPLIYSRYFYGHYNDLIIQAADGFYNTNIHFVTGDPPSQRMVIMDNGKVGIGTPNPTENLHVAGNLKIDGNLKVDGTIHGSINGDADTVDGKHATEFGDGHSLDAADGSSVDAVYIDNIGNVGIGTMEPTAKLDVNGDISQPRGGWKKLGQDRYTFSELLRGNIPTPLGGYTTVNIGSPFSLTRDRLWTGTITVAARTGGAEWDIQYFYYGNFWGHTIYGNDWMLAPITGAGLKMERPIDRSNTMQIKIPGNDEIQKLHIHIDMYVSESW